MVPNLESEVEKKLFLTKRKNATFHNKCRHEDDAKDYQVYDEDYQSNLRHHHQAWCQSVVQQRVVVVWLDSRDK